jgi:uncharacterized membrane protein
VPAGSRTITATASGYDTQNAPASVSEGVDTIVDFALDETPAGGSGAIRGTVYSTTGSKLADVNVQVLGGTSSLTNKGGKYTIQGVPAGLQTVIASKAGYNSSQQDVNVPAGSSVTLDFTLTPQ